MFCFVHTFRSPFVRYIDSPAVCASPNCRLVKQLSYRSLCSFCIACIDSSGRFTQSPHSPSRVPTASASSKGALISYRRRAVCVRLIRVTSFSVSTSSTRSQVADLSYNRIADVGDLSAYRNLEKLVLDNNRIRRIGTGLAACRSLRILSLSHNLLDGPDALSALSQPPAGRESGLLISQLDLSNNRLRSAAGLERQTRLQWLNLSGNRLRSLNGFENLDALNLLRLDQNDVIDIQELECI